MKNGRELAEGFAEFKVTSPYDCGFITNAKAVR
jgi:hypothetical protein